MECKGCDEVLSNSWPSTASYSVSSHLNLFLLLDLDSFGGESEADIYATLLHYNPSLMQIMTLHHLTRVLWQWGVSKAVGMDTLEAMAVGLHVGGSGHWVALQSRPR